MWEENQLLCQRCAGIQLITEKFRKYSQYTRNMRLGSRVSQEDNGNAFGQGVAGKTTQ